MSWLLRRLFAAKEQATPRFALQGTIHWMRALAILIEAEGVNLASISRHYADVQRRAENIEADTLSFEKLIMALHCLASLSDLNVEGVNAYNVVRSGIVSWYYAIYNSCQAMIAAASGATPQIHATTVRVWQSDIIERRSAITPFHYSMSKICPKNIDDQNLELRGNNPHDLNTYPTNHEEAYGAVISYLNGTADYERGRIEERIKKSREFGELGVDNFRTAKAREIRDARLSTADVNFLTQAFRYRGKANYRDSIYLSYGDDNSEKLQQFILDLRAVAEAFVAMACQYVSRRTAAGTWGEFSTDMMENARFSLPFDLNQCR